MRNWEKALIKAQASLKDALQVIDTASTQMALVVDDQRRLLGAISDGDVRRALISGQGLDDCVTSVMNSTPTCARASDSKEAIHALMRRHGFRQVPILDDSARLVGLETLDDFIHTRARNNWVVIMAGGLGSRLQELTAHTPKPMLKVGERPLLDTIIESFVDHGFGRFYLAVNYKAEQIEEYFGDGSRLGVQIEYIKERQRMGTAGALSLLPEIPSEPFIVTNADLLTKVDFGQFVDKHIEHQADATMAVRDYEMQVPFGVVRETEGRIEAIEEKPIQRFTVSAGMYVLSPHVLELVPRETFFDMPTLFEHAYQKGLNARCHRIHGYWLDIGRMPDYERANLEYFEVFK
jgi:dTDP-glucose pyrophosphorylase